MQMLIYMYVLIRQQFAKKDNPVLPGGVVYQHSDADAYFDKSETEAKLYMADGMALAEEEICRAFDKNEKGEYLSLIHISWPPTLLHSVPLCLL